MNWYYVIGVSFTAGTALVGIGVAYGAIKQRLISHESQDKQRFDATDLMLQEIRADVKTLLTTQ